jgi:hypothetical protein
MAQQQRGAVLHVAVQAVAVDVALQFVRGQHHHPSSLPRGLAAMLP